MAGSYLSDCCTAQRQRKNRVAPGPSYDRIRVRLDSIRTTQPPRSNQLKELSKKAKSFYMNHPKLGGLPHQNEQGQWLVQGRHGVQPWTTQEVENYVAWMQGAVHTDWPRV